MQRGGLKLAHQRRTRQLVLAALATAMMVAPASVDAQATTRFAVAGHGTLVAGLIAGQQAALSATNARLAALTARLDALERPSAQP